MASNIDQHARKACASWGNPDADPRLIMNRENAVFGVNLKYHGRAALRLHRPGYKTSTEIASELWWMRALADQGFPCPRPISATDGEDIVDLGNGLVATLISWVDGQPIGSSSRPLTGPTDLHRDMGRLLGRLHAATQKLDLPDWFTRPSWDRDGLVGEAPLWGRFWEHPSLNTTQSDLLMTMRDQARTALADYTVTGGKTQLIHADALRENVFSGSDGLTLIDFDDSGFGFGLHELAIAISQSVGDAEYASRRADLVRGYQDYCTLTAEEVALLPIFAALRACSSLGWTVPRMANDGMDVEKYLKRALKLSTVWLDTL
jgi:Ser/Thr protein kinase RdoA (MazF antagonist)